MTITCTVEQFARKFQVHPKTVREWTREGMPTVREGKKGLGNGSKIDLIRAVDWVRRKRKISTPEWADYFAGLPGAPPNPLRWLVELALDDMPWLTKAAILAWFQEVGEGKTETAWQQIGLTEPQARTVVWQMCSMILMFLHDHKVNFYEQQRLKPVTGGADLDDLASQWLSGNVRSEWKNTDVEIDDDILPFMPPETRAIFDKAGKPKA